MLIALAVAFALCEALFTMIEVALNAVPRSRMRALVESERMARLAATEPEEPVSNLAPAAETDRHTRGEVERSALRTLALLEQPKRLALLFITITSFTLWGAAAALAWQAQTQAWPWWLLVGAFVAVLFVAEVLPLLLAARDCEGIALATSAIATHALAGLSPLLRVRSRFAGLWVRPFGASSPAPAAVTQGELRTALAAAEEEGVIESDERAMLEGAIAFRGKSVGEVMTPVERMVAVSVDTSLRDLLRKAMEEGHSRLPIYEGDRDHITGIVATKDLLPLMRLTESSGQSGQPAHSVARAPFFVPAGKRIAHVLDDLRRQRLLMAIVQDEQGHTVGLVTIEDLLEEIVGEIEDEYDDRDPLFEVLDTESGRAALPAGAVRALLCDAQVTVRAVTEFWRQQWDENLRLRDHSGLPADTGLAVGKLAEALAPAPSVVGDEIAIGHIIVPRETEGPAEGADAPVGLRVEAVQGGSITRLLLFARAATRETNE